MSGHMASAGEKKLNRQQLEAIRHKKGPLLIIAGAGTGKTTVVTERIKYLISKGLATPAEILALTFTNKAAREMEERVDIALPIGYSLMWISTFHAFCDRVLRQEALNIGLDSKFRLMATAETIQFLRANLFKFDLNYFRPLGNPTKFVDGMLQHFSRLKDEDVAPQEYLTFAKRQKKKTKTVEEKEEAAKTLELANAYRVYEELKVKEGVMDFGDLITNTLKLFRTRKKILQNYQKQFKYILVDEFQDTNIAQYELLKVLAPPSKKPDVTVVADDSQSIYKFRGAAVSNILQFMKEYKGAKQVVLTKNYRSSQTILNQAYKLIKHNDPDTLEVQLGVSKDLQKQRRVREEKIGFLYTDRVENEAEAVAKKVAQLVDEKGYQYSDFAILVRANNHADPFVRAFARAGIPYQFLGPGMLFRQPEVKDLIAHLKVLYNFEDSVAMYKVLTIDHFDINARDLAAISNYSKRRNLSLFEAAEAVEKIFVSKKTKETINKIVKMIHRHLKLIPKETGGQILFYFLQDTGILRRLTSYDTPKDERRAQNISRFFDRLKTYEVEHEDASVFAVSDWIDLSMELGESPLAHDLDWTEINAVNILTCHSAKGLEFPVVFLVNLVAQRFPTIHRREQIPIPDPLIKEILPKGDYHLQEERRLFYVGMTRAMDRLFLVASNYYGEGKRERKISQFVFEALGEEAVKKPQELAEDQLSLLEWGKPKEVKEAERYTPINFLSYSQIDTFDTCPLKYRYRYIQRIPVPPGAAATFGSSMHQTLRDFYQEIKDGQKMTKGDLLKLLDLNWSPVGYASKAHEERRKKQGRQMLSDFYKKFDAKLVPKDVEQPFVIKVSPKLRIGGKIDRVDQKGKKLEIIDYKTGRVLDQKAIDKSLQMTVYAMAAVDKGIYDKNPEDVVLSFYFLDTGEKKSTKRTKKELQEAKRQLVEKSHEIEKSKFLPTPGIWCDFCDFKLLCEAWR